jgi:hypothetical protein
VALLTTCLRAVRALRGARALRFIAYVLLLLGSLNAKAQAAPSREYQVKAVFLFNFTQFVDWPPAAFAEDTTPLVIGVLGDDPFGRYLDDIIRGEQVNNRRLTVQRYRRPEDLKACQVLFVSRSEDRNLDQELAALKGMDVLTVSDADGFAARGGMIQLITENGKIRLKINVGAAKASSLIISSKLLRSAEIVASRDD